MNSFISDRSFSQNQTIPYQPPLNHKAEDFHQFQSPSVQNPNSKSFKVYSQTESDYNDVSSQGSMARATPNPANLNSFIRISKDEDHKHQEVQSNSNIQNQESSSDIHEPSSPEDEKEQRTSDELSRDATIAYYEREIENYRNQSRRNFNSSNRCRNPFQADKYYEEHLRCEEKISAFHNMCGHMLSKQYNYKGAVLEFQKASKIRDQVVYYYRDWGRQLDASKKESYASEKYETAEYFQSYLTQIYGNWGWALTRLKDFDFAIQKYREALEIYNATEECKRQGYRFAQKGKFQEASKRCLSKIYRNWGYTLSQQEKHEEALKKYKEIEQLKIEDHSIYTDMGYCYERLKKQDDAVECYRKAIDFNPERNDIQCEAYYLWGRILDEKGDHKGAIEKLKDASRLESQINQEKGKKVMIKCSNRLGLVYYKLKRYGEALALYEELKDDNHRYAFVSIYVGLIYAQIAYRQSKDEKYLDCSENKIPIPEENCLKLAYQYFNKGIGKYRENPGLNGDCVNAIQKEIERNEKILKRNPQNNDESRMIIAMLLTVEQKVSDLELIPEDSLNDKVPEVQNFENLEIFSEFESPDNWIRQFDMDFDLSIVGREEIDDSIPEVEDLAELRSLESRISELDEDPSLSTVGRNEIDDSTPEVENLLDSIKSKNAVEQIAHIKKYIEPFKAASKNWLDSYRRDVRQEKSLEKHIKLEVSISSIYNNWGYQLSTLHNYEEAIAKFEEAVTIIRKLRNLCKVGSKNRVHNCYYEANKGYRINNQLSGIYKNWGFALSRLGRFEEAVDKNKNALEENPRNDAAYKNLGFVLSRLREHKEAIQNYEKALEIQRSKKARSDKEALKNRSDYSKTSIYMGFSLTMLRKFAEATKIYESIVNDESQEISIRCDAYYEWANTLDEEGDSKGAMKKLNEALELQKGSDEQSYFRLLNRKGLLFYHQKEYEKAQELFEEITNQDSSYGFAHINQRLVHNQMYHIKPKNDSLLPEKEKSNADHSILFNEDNTYIVEEVSCDLSHLPENDKIEVKKRLAGLKDDIDTYERTATEIRNIVENLETNQENDQKDKYESYDTAIEIVKKSSYLLHDYIDIYKREAKKIEERSKRCKEEEEDLKARIHEMKEMKTELPNPKNADQNYDINQSVLGHSVEIQSKPPGFE